MRRETYIQELRDEISYSQILPKIKKLYLIGKELDLSDRDILNTLCTEISLAIEVWSMQ